MLDLPTRENAAAEPLGRPERELIETLAAAVYTTDRDGRIEYFNDAALQLWGRPPRPEERCWVGRALLNGVGAPLPPERCPMRKVLMGFPAAHNAELILERDDGSMRHVLANPRALFDASGRVRGACNTLVDITERKRAEAELAATRDELAAQVDSLTRLHEMAMRLGVITDMHLALKVILDTAVEAQRADFGLIWLQEPDSGDLVVHASRGFEDDKAFLFERVIPGPMGGAAGNAFHEKRRWVIEDIEADESFAAYRESARRAGFRAVHSTPIVTRSGAQLGALSVHFRKPCQPSNRDRQLADVCARHAADAIESTRNQEALRESERLYRAIGESIEHGVWTCDAEGGNTYMSEAFLRVTGLTAAECAGTGWMKAVHPDDAPRLREAWKRSLEQGCPIDAEHRVRAADGQWRSVLCRGVAVRDARGATLAWAGINLDIDRQKRGATAPQQPARGKEEVATASPRPPRRRVLVADADAGSSESIATMLESFGSEVLRSDPVRAPENARAFRPDIVLVGASGASDATEACRKIRAQSWATDVRIIALEREPARGNAGRPAIGFDGHLATPVEPFSLERVLREG